MGAFRFRLLGWVRSGWFCGSLPLALHDERNRAHDGLVLAIGDVISHGLLHNVPSFFRFQKRVRPGPPPVSGANGTEFQIREIEISGLACSGRPG